MAVFSSINKGINRFFSKLVKYPLLGALSSMIVGISVDILFELEFNDPQMGIIAGLLAAILTEMIILTNNSKLQEDVMSVLRENVNLLDDNGAVSNFISIKQITSLKSSNKHIEVQKDGITVIEPYVPDFWTLCIAHIEKELKVATYIDISTWWENASSKNNLLIQEFKATVQSPNVSIQRTFIYNPKKDDIDRLYPIAQAQAIRGIHVKCITINEVKILVKKYELPTENIHLIDNKWVGYHILNDAREPLEFRLSKDENEYSSAVSFFSELEQKAKDFDFSTVAKKILIVEKKRRFLQEFRETVIKQRMDNENIEEDLYIAMNDALQKIGEKG